ncbi:putative methionyl-tRNA synthetase [Hordeum vulgare]|nr:putative methionyl-tRNA synthetase [Hordeum vulgare]
MDRGKNAMVNHCAIIQQACNKWHGIQEEAMARPKSGANFECHDNNDQEFKFRHVFTRIESCEKWKKCQLALAKAKDGVYNPDTPASTAGEGCRDGNKRAKASRNAAPAAERL